MALGIETHAGKGVKAWRPEGNVGGTTLFKALGHPLAAKRALAPRGRLAATGAVARRRAEIPCGGSLLWRYSEMFDDDSRARAGIGARVQVRDATCRLLGFHALVNGEASFSLDHMFGF